MKDSGKKYLKNKNIQDSIVVFFFGLILVIYSQVMFHTTSVPTEWKLSPYLFPMLIAFFAICLSVSLLSDGLMELKTEQGKAEEKTPQDAKRALIVICFAAIYYLMLKYITFIPATILFLASMFLFFGERKYWLIGVLAAATSGILYVIFGVLLNVRLP